MKVSKITVGRLYNLGNYEHVRYELTVEVPEGQSAADAVRGLERIVAGLKPSRFMKTKAELDNEAARIGAMQAMDDETWQRNYGHCAGSREEVVARYVADFEKEKRKAQAERDRISTAQSFFDDVGGAAAWRDAKLDWQDDDAWEG